MTITTLASGTRTTERGNVIIALAPHVLGWLVQTLTDGRQTSSHRFGYETDALIAYRTLVAEHTPTIALAPPAKGTATKVTDPGHTILAVAAINGIVHRGGGVGQASVTQLHALAKRGMLDLVVEMQGRRKVTVAGRINNVGRNALDRLTEADREAARIAAAVVGTYSTVAA
jgi:hypothetical protein